MMNMGYETMAMSVEVGQEKNLEGSIYHLYVNQAWNKHYYFYIM